MKTRSSIYRAVASVALAATLALLPAASSLAQDQTTGSGAQSQANRKHSGISVPVTGTATAADGTVQALNGTLTIQRFARVEEQIFAVGTLVGTLTSDTPGTAARTFVTQVAMPLDRSGATAAAGDFAALAVCDILHLVLGPLDLNLLGLVIHLDTVVLDITAVSGPGNLLGNLLCAILGLLDGGAAASLVSLLNNLLGLLG
jgi:hypothetical protein